MLRNQKNIRVDRKKSNICRIPIVSLIQLTFCVEEKLKIVIVIPTVLLFSAFLLKDFLY